MIVCGTDLGPSGEHAARWAAALARVTGQTLRLVHVDDADHQSLDAFPESVQDAAKAFHERLDARRAEHEDRLKHLSDALSVETERKVLSGRPWEQIVADASERVAGTTGQIAPALRSLESYDIGAVIPGADGRHVTFVVKGEDAPDMVRQIHRALFPVASEAEGAVAEA